MLNGLDPILIFNLSKNVSFLKAATANNKIPVAAAILNKIDLPAIPIYLSQDLTGLQIDTEDKSLEIDTSMEASQDSTQASFITQRTLNNTVKINLLASSDSIGLTLLSALADFVFPLVTAKEISITYLHGPVTVFAGLLHSFNINQNSNNTLYSITIELVRMGILPKTGLTQIDATVNTTLTNGLPVKAG